MSHVSLSDARKTRAAARDVHSRAEAREDELRVSLQQRASAEMLDEVKRATAEKEAARERLERAEDKLAIEEANSQAHVLRNHF